MFLSCPNCPGLLWAQACVSLTWLWKKSTQLPPFFLCQAMVLRACSLRTFVKMATPTQRIRIRREDPSELHTEKEMTWTQLAVECVVGCIPNKMHPMMELPCSRHAGRMGSQGEDNKTVGACLCRIPSENLTGESRQRWEPWKQRR